MLRIDPEFKSLIPPLSADEYKQLEENIVAEGIRDPLVVWEVPNGDQIILDGHNRFEIAAKHGGIHFEVKKIHFADHDRERAIAWICNNQLGRRNLPLVDRVLLTDRKKDALSKIAKGNIGGDRRSEAYRESSVRIHANDNNVEDRSGRTDYKIAKEAGTSEDTVRKVRDIAKHPELLEEVRSGERSINSAYKTIAPPPSKTVIKQAIEDAKERHEQYLNRDKTEVVNFESAAQDRSDMDIILFDFGREIQKIVNNINGLGLFRREKEVEDIAKKMKPEDKKRILSSIQNCTEILNRVQMILMKGSTNG